MEKIWFDNWQSILKIIITSIVCFTALIIILRKAGKRTLSKMNAFDLVITISIGSVLATAITSKKTTVADGITALAILVFIQYAITWLSVRSKTIRNVVKSSPTVLFYNGDFIEDAMRDERITEKEVLSAMRLKGIAQPEQVHLVILETDGQMSVIEKK